MPPDISAQIEKWRKHLLDTTRRNRLINFKAGQTGGIRLIRPDPGDLWHSLLSTGRTLTFRWQRDLIDLSSEPEDDVSPLQVFAETASQERILDQKRQDEILAQCLASRRLRRDDLLTELTDQRLATRLGRLAIQAREALSEQGVTILHVAFGFLRWFETPDSDVETRSPLLLIPVRLDRESVGSPWRLLADEDEVLINHTLAQLLREDFRLNLPGEGQVDLDADDASSRTEYFEAIRRVIRHQERWEILDEAALGSFNFQKLAMWEDLGKNNNRIAAHPLCQAIADRNISAPAPPEGLPAECDLDEKTRPEQTYHILDADSSQHAAIVAVTTGANVVLDGPPGTGKSQTIANLIAEFLAAGKTVLFVSEKAAALDVVKRRLDDRGLGDFCLALHSHKSNKREVVAELGRCLSLTSGPLPDEGRDLRQLAKVRRELNDFVRKLHLTRDPLGMTAFQVHGELAALERLTGHSRCPIPRILKRDASFLQRIVQLLRGLPDCRAVVEDHQHHPWRDCRVAAYSLTLQDDVEHHLGRLADRMAQVADAAESLARFGHGTASGTFPGWRAAVAAARAILAVPLLPAVWLTANPQEVAKAVVEVDRVTRTNREVRGALAEFSGPALCGLTPDRLREMSSSPGSSGIPLKAGAELTVRGRLAALKELLGSLRRLRQLASELDGAVRAVIACFGVDLRPPPIRDLGTFVELAQLIARAPPMRRSWWNALRRQEVQAVASRAAEEERIALSQRTALLGRLTPEALAAASSPLIREAGGYRSFLFRLWPRWWTIKRRLAGWYLQGPPASSELLMDVQELAAYHRRNEYLRQLGEQYADDLVTGEGGRPDWDATLEGLRTAERLEQHFKAPADLQSALTPGGRADRQSLPTTTSGLARQEQAFRLEWGRLVQETDLRGIQEEGNSLPRGTTSEVVEWLDCQIAACEGESAAVEQLAAMLAEGQDLSWTAVPKKVKMIARLIKARTTLAALLRRGLIEETVEAAEEKDWGTLGVQATQLLSFLSDRQGMLDDVARKGLTDAGHRTSLQEALKRNDEVCSATFAESWQFLTERLFDPSRNVSTGIVLNEATFDVLAGWLEERATDAGRLFEWVRYCEIESEARAGGVSTILDEVRSGQVKPEEAADVFRTRFLRLWLDALYEQVPALGRFTTERREALIGRFVELDRQSVASAPARVRHRLLSHSGRPGAVADPPERSEMGVLLREVNKKKRHLPLRNLFAGIPTLLPRLKPCLMMSPLAVSTYLQSPDCNFDLVIFDEASQVRPHDAVCAVYRGRQLVVAGDQKQLPPTSFFERSSDGDEPGEDEASALGDYESLLDVCCTLGLVRKRLRWHYRSRREGLISFANHFIYGDELVTFPSARDVAGDPAVAFEYVAEGRWQTGAGVNPVEACRVAQMVLDHAQQHPDNVSLGVIAFSQRQQMQILDELERMRRARPDLESFFREDRDEPFFVKNLENVQGDERDVVFLSVGYGPDDSGRVAMRFGPLNRQGGERRLNVAVTRTRERMTVVSSLRAEDIDLSRTSAHGVRLLRAYLDYAEHGPESLRAVVVAANQRDFDSPFERAVAEGLERRGLTVHSQIGCGSFRIDLGLVEPETPGRYLLGVECDGATYHSSATARDRDRLRQSVLEQLGWRLCRVWSTDWLRDRERQVGRVLEALEQSRHASPSPVSSVAGNNEAHQFPGPQMTVAASEPASLTLPVEPEYESIEDVPPESVREQILMALRNYGVTDREDLVQKVARQLGFKRTGPRIKEAIEAAIEKLIADGKVAGAAEQNCVKVVNS